MSIIYNDTQEKSELQRKIVAELREKQAATSLCDDSLTLSGFDDSNDPDYVHEIKLSRPVVWVIVLVAMIIVAVVLYLLAK